MARKPTLSPSKITTYLACPVKYRWTYVDARGKWYMKAKSYYSFGSTLHRVLERFYNEEDGGVTTTEEALASYEESWIDAGYRSAEEMAEAFGDGREILERHVEEAIKIPRIAKTILVERQLRHDLGPFVLLGRLDRVDEYPDGTLEVVDYKSGREVVTEDDVATDIAMNCYQVLLRAKYPDRQVRARIVALRTGSSAASALSDSEAEELLRDLAKLGTEILSTEYAELTPTAKPLCPRCDFLPLCKQNEDFAAEFLAKETA
jgi:putative RecB family exonuclease